MIYENLVNKVCTCLSLRDLVQKHQYVRLEQIAQNGQNNLNVSHSARNYNIAAKSNVPLIISAGMIDHYSF